MGLCVRSIVSYGGLPSGGKFSQCWPTGVLCTRHCWAGGRTFLDLLESPIILFLYDRYHAFTLDVEYYIDCRIYVFLLLWIALFFPFLIPALYTMCPTTPLLCYNFLFSFPYYVTHADSPPLFPLFLTLCHHCDSILVKLHQGLAHDAKWLILA